MKQPTQTADLVIIGGGIMGLMTAYYASAFVKNIVVIEKRTIGNKEASSFSFTRSLHTDYLDSLYARLAYEARDLWLELQQKTGRQLFADCGCLSIAKKTVTPDLDETYAAKSYEVVERLNFQPERFSKEELRKRFPQFDADFVEECLPALKGARSEDVTDADQCFYDLVADDNFILGGLPGFKHIFIGTGWRGAGYKFSPLIGKILSQLALQSGTVYDIKQFSPGRF